MEYKVLLVFMQDVSKCIHFATNVCTWDIKNNCKRGLYFSAMGDMVVLLSSLRDKVAEPGNLRLCRAETSRNEKAMRDSWPDSRKDGMEARPQG